MYHRLSHGCVLKGLDAMSILHKLLSLIGVQAIQTPVWIVFHTGAVLLDRRGFLWLLILETLDACTASHHFLQYERIAEAASLTRPQVSSGRLSQRTTKQFDPLSPMANQRAQQIISAQPQSCTPGPAPLGPLPTNCAYTSFWCLSSRSK